MSNFTYLPNFQLSVCQNTHFLLDTSALTRIFMAGTTPSPEALSYQMLYADLVSQNKSFIFSSYQMMEFFNLFTRTHYNHYKSTHGANISRKHFRTLPEYSQCLTDFYLLFDSDLKPYSLLVDDIFDFSKQQEYMSHLLTLDFHDMLYCYLSEKYDAPIITHDRDFMSAPFNLDVISLLTPPSNIT